MAITVGLKSDSVTPLLISYQKLSTGRQQHFTHFFSLRIAKSI
jgi:hypothetical protein